MKPLAFNLRNAKKVHGDKHSSTFHLENGHSIVVAHSALPALQRKQIERMPVHLAEGGYAEPAGADSDIFANSSRAIQKANYGKKEEAPSEDDGLTGDDQRALEEGLSIPGNKVPEEKIESDADGTADVGRDPASVDPFLDDTFDKQTAGGTPEQPSAVPSDKSATGENTYDNPVSDIAANQLPQKLPQIPSAAVNDPNDPYGSKSAIQAQIGALGEQKQAQLEQNKIEAAGAYREADIERQNLEIQKQQIKKYQANQEILNQEHQKIFDEVNNHKTDPDRYINSMSTGKKVAQGIGLFLGSIGAAKTGGKNYAFENLQQNIANDIKAQEDDLGAKKSLLSDNLARTGNLMLATNLTAFQTNSLISAKLKQNAQYTTNALEKSKNLQAAGMFDAKAAELQHQMSLQGALLSGQSGQSSEQEFRNRMQYLRINGQEKAASDSEKKHIPGLPGSASREVTSKDYEQWENLTNLTKNYNEAQNFLNEVGKSGAGYLRGNPGLAAKGKSIEDQLALEMGKLADLQRFTPEEKKIYVNRVPDLTGTHLTSQDQEKLSQLQKEVADKVATFKNGLGFSGGGGESYQAQGSHAPQAQSMGNQALQWLNDPKNANDPRRAEVAKKLGVK